MIPLASLVTVLLLAPDAPSRPTDPLASIALLEGRWTGTAQGEPGKGTSTREYARELGGKFIAGRNRTVYEPRSPGGAPEVHEDLAVFSYDKAARKIVLRQFHGEGFVNEYTLEATAGDGKTLTFVTARIENIAPGWRAREEYRVVSPDDVVETFSLAAPGKDFEIYSTTRLKRAEAAGKGL